MTSVKVHATSNKTATVPMVEDNDTSIMNVEPRIIKPLLDHHRSYTSVMQGLTLNLNEPWERSLSRLLEDVSNTNEPNHHMMNSYSSNTAVTPSITSPTSTVPQTTVPELMLLSRTESRDYALEIEGDSSSGTIMNLSMDDTTTSSSIVSNGTKNTSPIRRHPIGSIYRKTLSKKQLNTTGRKSLFDDSDNDDESNDTAASGKCRLVHKFSSDSLFLFYEQQQQQQQQNLEDRGEQEDDSDRKMADANGPNERSFSIHKASAICDENEYDHDDDYYYNNNSYYESRRLFIPDPRPTRPSINRYPPSNLYLPTF